MRALTLALVMALLPRLGSAQQVDTIAVLAAIARAERATFQRIDSMDASLCAQGRREACHPPIDRRWIWYVDSASVTGRLAATLASIDSFEVRAATQSRPVCPWESTAPEAGQLMRVTLSARSDSAVTVEVWGECANPPGHRSAVIRGSRTWEVLRNGSIWKSRYLRSMAT